MSSSYVITLEMDPRSFAWLNDLRRQHFPAARNFLDAHLTLFHKIDQHDAATIEQLVPLPHRFALRFDGVRFLGRGVAIDIHAPSLSDFRSHLATAFWARLTAQDRQPFRPHVTIQNKADPPVARALYDALESTFEKRIGEGTAILIWEYLGGPWRLAKRIPLGCNGA